FGAAGPRGQGDRCGDEEQDTKAHGKLPLSAITYQKSATQAFPRARPFPPLPADAALSTPLLPRPPSRPCAIAFERRIRHCSPCSLRASALANLHGLLRTVGPRASKAAARSPYPK